jgi:hypothetical protein
MDNLSDKKVEEFTLNHTAVAPIEFTVDWSALNNRRNRKVLSDWWKDAKKPGGSVPHD